MKNAYSLNNIYMSVCMYVYGTVACDADSNTNMSAVARQTISGCGSYAGHLQSSGVSTGY